MQLASNSEHMNGYKHFAQYILHIAIKENIMKNDTLCFDVISSGERGRNEK